MSSVAGIRAEDARAPVSARPGEAVPKAIPFPPLLLGLRGTTPLPTAACPLCRSSGWKDDRRRPAHALSNRRDKDPKVGGMPWLSVAASRVGREHLQEFECRN